MSKKYLLIDTETIGSFGSQLVYDTGLLVMDENGVTYAEHSFLTRGLFDDIKLMATAFYANRYNKYLDAIASGETKVVEWQTVLDTIQKLITIYEIDTIAAYNETFDNTAMENTTKHFFDNGNWISDNITHFCIWSAACQTFFDEMYINIARQKQWVTDKDNVKTSAEMAYRYITGNNDFNEAHTGLEDCRIEAKILLYILNSGKPFDPTPKAFPMRQVYELDTVWQIRDLERKELEALEIAEEIRRLTTNLKNRTKTIYKWRDKLSHRNDAAMDEVEEVLSTNAGQKIRQATRDGAREHFSEK